MGGSLVYVLRHGPVYVNQPLLGIAVFKLINFLNIFKLFSKPQQKVHTLNDPRDKWLGDIMCIWQKIFIHYFPFIFPPRFFNLTRVNVKE